jgi:hypothetical protein
MHEWIVNLGYAILEFFQTNGYKVVPISEIILDGEYYMDHAGKQCPVTE